MLEARVQAIVDRIAEKPYVLNVKSTLEATQRERVFVPDPARLSGTGLTPQDVAQTLRLYLSGTQAATARRSGEEYPVVVQADPLRYSGEGGLLSLPVYAPALQAFLPLGSLGRFEERPSPTLISRRNQAYAAGININLKPEAPGALQVQAELEQDLRAAGLLGDGVELVASGLGSFTEELASSRPSPSASPSSSTTSSSPASSTPGATPSTSSSPCPWPWWGPSGSPTSWARAWT